MNRWKKDREVPDEPLSPRPTETFWTRHVRLITFLATVGLFLLIAGPILFMEAYDFHAAKDYLQKKDERPEMTLENLYALSDMSYVTEDMLTRFASTVSEPEGGASRIIRVSVENGRYMLIATVRASDGVAEQCLVCDMKTEGAEELDVLKDDLRAAYGK